MTQPGHQCGQSTSCPSDQRKSAIDSLTTSRITSHLPGTAAHSQAVPLLPKELGNTQVSPKGASTEEGPEADVLRQDLSLKSSSLKIARGWNSGRLFNEPRRGAEEVEW